MQSYTPIFEPFYNNGWENQPSENTPIMGEALEEYDSTFKNIELFLANLDLSGLGADYALLTEAGYSLAIGIDNNYVMTISLKNKAGTVLDSKSIDFPIESMVVNATYANGIVTFTLQNGNVLDVDISDLVRGLVPTSRTIAGVDLVDDITAEELKDALGMYDEGLTAGTLKPWLYDTEKEVEIGVYNGKPVYRKYFTIHVTTVDRFYYQPITDCIPDYEKILNHKMYTTSGNLLNAIYANQGNQDVQDWMCYFVNAGGNVITVSRSLSQPEIDADFVFMAEYTKTTDAEGSGNNLNPYGIYDAKLDDVKTFIDAVSDEVDAVEAQLSDKVLPQFKAHSLTTPGWYRIAKLNAGNPNASKGAMPSGLDVQITRGYSTAPPEMHRITVTTSFYNSVKFSNEISNSDSVYFTKIRYTADESKSIGYIEVYYNKDTNNTCLFALSNRATLYNPDSFWNVIEPTLTEETLEGVTVLGTHEFSANKSYESEIEALNSMVVSKYMPLGTDLDSLTTQGIYFFDNYATNYVNTPSDTAHNGIMTVDAYYYKTENRTKCVQRYTSLNLNATFERVQLISGTWTAWKQTGNQADITALQNLVGKLKYEWTATIKCATWSRLCYVANKTNYNTSYLLHIGITRSGVIIDDTFLINCNGTDFGSIVKVNGCSNYGYSVRSVLDEKGNGYFEIYEEARGATSDTTQYIYCSLIPLATGDVVTSIAGADGTTIPGGYTVAKEMLVTKTDFQSDVTDELSTNLGNIRYLLLPRTMGDASQHKPWVELEAQFNKFEKGMTYAGQINCGTAWYFDGRVEEGYASFMTHCYSGDSGNCEAYQISYRNGSWKHYKLINQSDLAYKNISSSIDVGETGCTASGYVENGQVVLQILVPTGKHVIDGLSLDSTYAPRHLIPGSFIGGQTEDRGGVDIMYITNTGSIYISYAKELTAKGYVTFTYPLKSS